MKLYLDFVFVPAIRMDNQQTSLGLIKHYMKYTNVAKENQIVLIMDNHEFHLSIPVTDYGRKHGVKLLAIHPHCSEYCNLLMCQSMGHLKLSIHLQWIQKCNTNLVF